jgi:hypothetical protein
MLFLQLFVFVYPLLTVIYNAFLGVKQLVFLLQIIFTFFLTWHLYSFKKKLSKQSKKINTLVIIFLAINIISCIRGFYNDQLALSSLIFNISNLIFFYVAGRFALVMDKKQEIISSLYLGILLVAIIEIILLYLSSFSLQSITSNNIIDVDDLTIGSENSLAGFFGFSSKRTVFPLSSVSWGATHLGSIIGVLFVSSFISLIHAVDNNRGIWLFITRNSLKFLVHCASISASFWIIVLADARAAFVSSFISVVTFLILRSLNLSLIKLLLKYVPLIFISFYLFSFLYVFVKDIIEYTLEITNLYRGNSTDAFSNRGIIWDSVLNLFAADFFSPDHIIGYGMWGQYVSGVNKMYESQLFTSSNLTSNHFSLHSTILQQLIDNGYLGIFVYISLTFLVLKSSKKFFLKTISNNAGYQKSNFSIFFSGANLGVLFYLIMVGAADPVITTERLFSMDIYLMLAINSLTLV